MPRADTFCNTFPHDLKALSQTALGPALLPVSEQTMHRLGKIHRRYVDYSVAKGTASSMMVETVGMEQKWKDVCVERLMVLNWALLSIRDTCFPC